MKYDLKKNNKITIPMLFLGIYLGFLTPLLSWYSYTEGIPNMKVSTGILDMQIKPRHIKILSFEEGSTPQTVTIENVGTLDLKYQAYKINKSHDCQYVGAKVRINEGIQYVSTSLLSNELIPPSSLVDEDLIEYVFFLKEEHPKRNINCEINMHIVAWQGIFPNSSKGFTDKEILHIGVLFKNRIVDTFEMSEVKSFTTSDNTILPNTLP